MRSTRGDRLQRLHHHPLHVVVPYRARRSRARLVQQAIVAVAQKPPPPLAHGRAGRAELSGYLHVAPAGGALQHDPRPQDQRLRCLGPSHPALQFLPLSLRQIWNLSRVVVRHRRSPPQGRSTMARPHLLVNHFSDGTLGGRRPQHSGPCSWRSARSAPRQCSAGSSVGAGPCTRLRTACPRSPSGRSRTRRRASALITTRSIFRVAGTVRAGAGRPYAAENRLPDHRVAGCVRQTWTRTVIAIAASAPTAAWASLIRCRSTTGECRLRELEQRMPPRRPQECRWWVIVPAGFQGPLLRQPSRCG